MKQIFSYGVIPFIFLDWEYKVLILQNSRTKIWTFPKWKKEWNETDMETAIREFREETGLADCYILEEENFHYSYLKQNENWEKSIKNVTLFVWFIKNNKVKFPEREICDYKFVSVSQLGEYFPQQESKNLLRWIQKYYENNLN